MTVSSRAGLPLVGGRLLAAALLLSVSVYYLLASIPFSYYHFLQFAHFWWLPAFVWLHPLLMLAGSGLLILTLPAVPVRWRLRVAVIAGLPSLWMAATVWVPEWLSYESATVLCWVPLLVLALGSTLDLVVHRDRLRMAQPFQASPRTLIEVAVVAAAAATGLYSIHNLLARSATSGGLESWEYVIAFLGTLVGHISVFVGAVLPLALLNPGRRRGPTLVHWLMSAGWVSALLSLLIRRTMLNTLTLGDLYATVLSVAIGLVLVVFGWALALPRVAVAGRGEDRPAMHTGRVQAGAARAPLITAIICLPLTLWLLPRWLLLADWGLTVQKLLVMATWVATVVIVREFAGHRRARIGVATGVVAALMVAFTGAVAGARSDAPTGLRGSRTVMLTLERYATRDASFDLVLDLLRPAMGDREFYANLRSAGDVTDDRSLRAVPMPVVPTIAGKSEYLPHVFVIVVDSLRPDYLAPYNGAAAAFTPAIHAFARESIVMRRAFTPYAGTSLAQPAIWAGGLIPRANYPRPFSAFNNLERLLKEVGYRQYVSVDQILGLILEDPSRPSNLEPHLTRPDTIEEAYKFDLCTTVAELERQLDRDRLDERPIFVYTQPQNLHIRVLASGYPEYKGVRFDGVEFFKPAVDAIRRVDGCVGAFIEGLKRRGLYDDSIVILTSDHGDSYGEDGRWGHAFYLVPETIRIPLMIRVPDRLLAGRVWDPEAVAMLTDITPTLYELLGYGYEPSTSLLGRPLLTLAGGNQAAATTRPYLVQSGYSRAYGLLDADGRWLYAANANQLHEHLYRLTNGRGDEIPIDAATRVQYRTWLLEEIERLNHYHIGTVTNHGSAAEQ